MKIRIDLHTHTNVSKLNGDKRIDFESVEKAITIFKDYNIKIAAFSDHNSFDSGQYLKAKKISEKLGILFLPAIEVNVKRSSDNNLANIIYVFDNNLSEDDLKKIELIAKKVPKKGIRNNEINLIFKDFETIIIPHVGKSDSFKIEDLDDIEINAIEISSKNNKNYLRSLKKGYQGSVVAFSDTHNWRKYPELNNLITIIDMDENKINFQGLKEALSLNKDFTKER